MADEHPNEMPGVEYALGQDHMHGAGRVSEAIRLPLQF
jgi:hypothetical protein